MVGICNHGLPNLAGSDLPSKETALGPVGKQLAGANWKVGGLQARRIGKQKGRGVRQTSSSPEGAPPVALNSPSGKTSVVEALWGDVAGWVVDCSTSSRRRLEKDRDPPSARP